MLLLPWRLHCGYECRKIPSTLRSPSFFWILADTSLDSQEEYEARIAQLTAALAAAERRCEEVASELSTLRAQMEARYNEILAELNAVLDLSIAGAMAKVATTITLTEGFKAEIHKQRGQQ